MPPTSPTVSLHTLHHKSCSNILTENCYISGLGEAQSKTTNRYSYSSPGSRPCDERPREQDSAEERLGALPGEGSSRSPTPLQPSEGGASPCGCQGRARRRAAHSKRRSPPPPSGQRAGKPLDAPESAAQPRQSQDDTPRLRLTHLTGAASEPGPQPPPRRAGLGRAAPRRTRNPFNRLHHFTPRRVTVPGALAEAAPPQSRLPHGQ